MKKFIKWTSLVLGGLSMLVAVSGLTLYSVGMKKLNQTYPNIAVETVNIPTDADAIARGKHVATIWACTRCHGNLIGNIVKNWKQDEFIHTFKTGVSSDGKQFGPTMSSNTFREMTDTELTALWLYFTNPKP